MERSFTRFGGYYAPAIVVTLAVLVALVLADTQRRSLEEEYLRSFTTEQLGLLRSRLEGNIQGDIKLVQGLVATISTEPDISQARYADLAARIFTGDTRLRNLAIAPDFVVSLVYPIRGNERSIGLNYRENAAQRDAALRVRDEGRLIITGPVDLVQGGRGLIARYPIYIDQEDGGRTFRGIASAVIDLEKLIAQSGLSDPALEIEVSLTSVGGAEKEANTFFGSPSTFDQDPIRMTIDIGHEQWVMAAVPKAGWHQESAALWFFRAALALLAMIIVAPMFWVGYLMKERHRHILALQQREEQYEALSQRLETALDASRVGVWELDIASGKLVWDDRMRALYDIPPEQPDCSYEDWRNALHPDDLEEAERIFSEAIANESNYVTQFRVRAADGSTRHIRAHGVTYRTSSGATRIVGANWDVTSDIMLQAELREAKRSAEVQNVALEEARRIMEHNSLHDALTGLPNRRYLDQALARADLEGGRARPLSILHMDLDRFKEINDTLGHAAGDAILKRTAAVLRERLPEGDFVARIGGDEFVLLSAAHRDTQGLIDFAGVLIGAVSVPMTIDGHECRVGASVGLATRALSGESAEQLLVNADIALYEAKRLGRNRVAHFNDELRLNTIAAKRTGDEILNGLERNEFTAYFQPQFDARSLEIVGVEALARWHHPERGVLGPEAFLPTAESLNVVASIDEAILHHALFQACRWDAAGLDIPKVSVNVSCQRLRDETLVEKLRALNIRPGSLSFELLESISFDGADDTLKRSIEEIKQLGIDIEIDDFGTGYASIVSLLELSPRRLKIDRRLIMPIIGSPSQQSLVGSIIDIGRVRGIEIVAEGVETPAHATLLRDLGCHTLQGYAFAKPMSADAFLAFAEERAWLKTPGLRRA